VLGALGLVWASFVLVGYKTGEHEADELTDGHPGQCRGGAARLSGRRIQARPRHRGAAASTTR
jgi:hypothetical protein